MISWQCAQCAQSVPVAVATAGARQALAAPARVIHGGQVLFATRTATTPDLTVELTTTHFGTNRASHIKCVPDALTDRRARVIFVLDCACPVTNSRGRVLYAKRL